MKKIIFVLITGLLLGCSSQRKEKQKKSGLIKKPITINIDLNSADKYKFEEIIDSTSISFINLQTTNKCLIGKIRQFYKYNNIYTIVSNNKLFLFDNDGNFIRKIDKTGKGPGEYISLTDVFMDELGIIYILDRKGRKIVKYNKFGKHLKTLKTKLIGDTFTKINNDVFCIYIGSNITNSSKYRINFYSEKQNKIISKNHIINKNEYEWRYFREINNFTKKSNEILLEYACNDTIYSISNNNIEKKAIINWGKYDLPLDFINQDFKDVRDFVRRTKGKYIYSTIGLFSNNTHLSFGFRQSDNMYQVIYNWDTKNISLIEGFSNPFFINKTYIPIQFSMLPKASCNEYFYGIINPYLIKKLKDQTKFIPDPLKKLKHDENPIIVKYKYNKKI